MSIVDYSQFDPAIDPIFGPTAKAYYWSSTYLANSLPNFWAVEFSFGDVDSFLSNSAFHVRAVRGGQ